MTICRSSFFFKSVNSAFDNVVGIVLKYSCKLLGISTDNNTFCFGIVKKLLKNEK